MTQATKMEKGVKAYIAAKDALAAGGEHVDEPEIRYGVDGDDVDAFVADLDVTEYSLMAGIMLPDGWIYGAVQNSAGYRLPASDLALVGWADAPAVCDYFGRPGGDMYLEEEDAAKAGKGDPYCEAVGSFVVAAMSCGGYDYFARGTLPNRRGEVDGGANIVSQHVFRGRSWRTV